MYQPSFMPRLTPMATAYPSSSMPAPVTMAPTMPTTHTQDPIVTGTSVLAIKYKDGVMMAADTLASYGSLARFKDMERMLNVGDGTLMGFTGDMSDFQYLKHRLESVVSEEYSLDDGHKMAPSHFFNYLASVMYQRRNKGNPLWNVVVVAGFKDGESFLGVVDLRGGTYKASTVGTGYGGHLAQPLLRQRVEGRENEITEEEAKNILEESMRVLLYRDARTINRIQVAKVTAKGVDISEPYSLTTDWSVGNMVKGYK